MILAIRSAPPSVPFIANRLTVPIMSALQVNTCKCTTREYKARGESGGNNGALNESVTKHHAHTSVASFGGQIATRSWSPRALQAANQISQRSTSHRCCITKDSFQSRRLRIVDVAICCHHDVARRGLISASSIDLVGCGCFQSRRVTFR